MISAYLRSIPNTEERAQDTEQTAEKTAYHQREVSLKEIHTALMEIRDAFTGKCDLPSLVASMNVEEAHSLEVVHRVPRVPLPLAVSLIDAVKDAFFPILGLKPLEHYALIFIKSIHTTSPALCICTDSSIKESDKR